MQGASAARATPSGRTVALLGGFLFLVALFVIAFFLLARAPHAGAQTTESPNGSDPPPASDAQGGDPAQGVAPDSSGPTLSAPAASVTVDSPLVDQVVTSEPVTVQLPVPPVLPDLPSASLSAPGVRVATGPLPTLGSHQPPPSGSATAHAPLAADPPPPNGGGATPSLPAGPSHASTGAHARATSELSRAASSSTDGGTRAPPWGPSPITADGSSVARTSTANDAGSGMLLLAVLAAGILFALGRGRRLWREAIGWLPAPWCPLPERPG